MRLRLAPPPDAPPGPTIPCRNVSAPDAPALGRLLHAAYRGTVDDEGETEEDAFLEACATIGGRYGAFLRTASFLHEDSGAPRSATLVSFFEPIRRPLLAFSITDPGWQNRGLATALLRRTIGALHAAGHEELALAVTLANAPAMHLYGKLGFERFEP
ncbi:MAG: GNAT family N-acetyltransferase [Planctomycetales bacterium]|nr:GNAT family N-acetyltransferase [Planctomycetales bacterium]